MSRAPWDFDKVAQTFEEHARQSIPLYDEIHSLTVSVAEHFLPNRGVGTEPSVVLDIGCSTGNLLSRFASQLGHLNLDLVGVDKSQEMINFARQNYGDLGVTFSCENVETMDFHQAEVVVANFVLQFLEPKMRAQVLDKVRASLPRGGCLIVFEKHFMPLAQMESIATDIYFDWKSSQGLDESEIRGKTRALRGAMSLVDKEYARAELKNLGFSQVTEVFQWLGFSGRIAIK